MLVVSYLKFCVPPSAGRPSDTANASIKVDLPTPFSPTKNVTGLVNSIDSKFFINGMLYGYSSLFSSFYTKLVHYLWVKDIIWM